jgi:hypothetical protein
MSKQTTVRVACSACGKGYRVAATAVGRWAQCHQCGRNFQLVAATVPAPATPSAPARTTPPPAPATPSPPQPPQPPQPQPTVSRNGDRAAERPRAIPFEEPSPPMRSIVAPPPPPVAPPAPRAEQSVAPCPLCLAACRADLARCPSCGLLAHAVAAAFTGKRFDRYESELRATARIAMILGVLAFGASPILILCGLFRGSTVCGGAALVAGALLAFGGHRGYRFDAPSRIPMATGFGLLAILCVVALASTGSGPLILWSLLGGAFLATLAALPFLPPIRPVYSAVYQVAIRPDLRHDQPKPIAPAIAIAIAALGVATLLLG